MPLDIAQIQSPLGQALMAASLPVALASNQPSLPVTHEAHAAGGGTSLYHAVAAATTNAASVKASAGQVFGYFVFNAAAYPVYVKLFNKASAPTPGTDTPAFVIGVPAGGGANLSFTVPLTFGTGIGVDMVKGIADADATALAASDCVFSLQYA